uniref:Uncharacterized protein n=1 Tax=Stomoxys calcitrans TaxID=35570 RepID=A0A1I8NS64_STOCA
MKSPQATDILAPRPVHPRAMRNHGLLSANFVYQHMVIDERWTTASLINEFQGMTKLLNTRLIFKNLEHRAHRKVLLKSVRHLRLQCRNGRTKLKNIHSGDNVKEMRNVLINHKDLQRLYQNMPIPMVVDDIDQRSFILRKEKDRLMHRFERLTTEYELKLLQRAQIELRIKYQNEFVLDEELQMRELRKNIQNSNTRLSAIKAVNTAYAKILEILNHDAVYYEPILHSLCGDIEDQGSFIKHILYLGTPAIAKFEQLSLEYRKMQDLFRKQTQIKLQNISSYKKSSPHPDQSKVAKAQQFVINMSKHYARETKSMLVLKNELESIETVINQIKIVTLCSHARDIFPRFRSQTQDNLQLMKENEISHLHNDFLTFKEQVASQQQSILMNNYYEEEERRILRITELKENIKAEDERKEHIILHMKNRAAVFVILRFNLWNISDILRHVGRPHRIYTIEYPTPYLKLPLLKYEMLTMYSVPPELFEQDIKTILQNVERKLKTLMNAYEKFLPDPKSNRSLDPVTFGKLYEEYHEKFLVSMELEDHQEGAQAGAEEEKELAEDAKFDHNVPNRKQLKALSARLVEELSKKEE